MNFFHDTMRNKLMLTLQSSSVKCFRCPCTLIEIFVIVSHEYIFPIVVLASGTNVH
jgi:hypothetical protein